MGRLIDFDTCEKILTEFYESSLNSHDAGLFVEFMAQLESVPTAYDVDKVVTEVMKFHNTTCNDDTDCRGWNCNECFEMRLRNIVNKGAVTNEDNNQIAT